MDNEQYESWCLALYQKQLKSAYRALGICQKLRPSENKAMRNKQVFKRIGQLRKLINHINKGGMPYEQY